MGLLSLVFKITLAEFDVLWRCRRDDVTLYGLNPNHCSTADKEQLRYLKNNDFIELSLSTGKWELTDWGMFVVKNAPLLVHSNLAVPRRKGEVVPFPVGCKGKFRLTQSR